ncbi:MAG: hypothetical protein GX102_13160 [Porphyromonadaceae bacterium]|jgi:hypothetical protein|nr:hypothetical protein [Porphyromonadaceae bacterium]
MNIYEMTDRFPAQCNWKYQDETVKEVLMKDSGYIKDLILLNEKFAISESCFEEAKELTKGFTDKRSPEIINDVKQSKIPYDYDFNDQKLLEVNRSKLSK